MNSLSRQMGNNNYMCHKIPFYSFSFRFISIFFSLSVTSPVAFLDMGMIYPRAVYGLGWTRKHDQSFITYCNAPLLKEQELLQKKWVIPFKGDKHVFNGHTENISPLPCPLGENRERNIWACRPHPGSNLCSCVQESERPLGPWGSGIPLSTDILSTPYTAESCLSN